MFGINQGLAALNAALGRLRRRPEVAPQPGTLPAGASTGKLVGPGWHENPGAAAATDLHVRLSVRDRVRRCSRGGATPNSRALEHLRELAVPEHPRAPRSGAARPHT